VKPKVDALLTFKKQQTFIVRHQVQSKAINEPVVCQNSNNPVNFEPSTSNLKLLTLLIFATHENEI
jgi:hypothetical protein